MTTKARRSCLLLVCALLLSAPVASSQSIGADYRAIVEEYRSSPNGAAERALALPPTALDEAVALAVRPEASGGWPARELLRAIMLHSDIAAYFLVQGTGPAQDHLDRAERLLTAVLARSNEYEWFEREWSGGIAHVLRQTAAGRPVPPRATRPAGKGWNEFVAGVAFEVDGSDQAVFGSAANPLLFWLNAARDRFTRALALDPRLLDAALHLGRIELLYGRDDRAEQFFMQARTSTRPSTVSLAELFSGTIAERRGMLDDAEHRYRKALAVFPGSQAAPLSLAQLLDRTGRTVEGRKVIDDLLARAARKAVFDPWWFYFVPGHTGLAFLRQEVAQ